MKRENYYDSAAHRRWRELVLRRAGYLCEECKRYGRNCYMMELDPHYVDVIIARWEQFTGQKAVLLKG